MTVNEGLGSINGESIKGLRKRLTFSLGGGSHFRVPSRCALLGRVEGEGDTLNLYSFKAFGRRRENADSVLLLGQAPK